MNVKQLIIRVKVKQRCKWEIQINLILINRSGNKSNILSERIKKARDESQTL